MEVFHINEDIKLSITFTDDDDNKIDADAVPTITIKRSNKKCVDAVNMTWESTGVYYYWWNTASEEADVHSIEITAEFSSRTDITQDTIVLK